MYSEKLLTFFKFLMIYFTFIFILPGIAFSQNPDAYEDDNSFVQAYVIDIDDPNPQYHDFRKEGDEDWVKFYGIADNVYTIAIDEVKSDCKAVIGLYDTDGITLILEDTGLKGKNVKLTWDDKCPKDGIYYVRVSNYNNLSGENTGYALTVGIPTAPYPGEIVGRVYDDSDHKKRIRNAIIKTFELNTEKAVKAAISYSADTYDYFIYGHPEGDYTLTAYALGYKTFSTYVVVSSLDTEVEKDIYMKPVDLSDAIAVLKIISGITCNFNVMNKDNKTGLEDAVYILQKIRGLRD